MREILLSWWWVPFAIPIYAIRLSYRLPGIENDTQDCAVVHSVQRKQPLLSGIENDSYPLLYTIFHNRVSKTIPNSWKYQIFGILLWYNTIQSMTSEEFFKKENPVRWLFERFPELNAGQIAKDMGINETLFRNYINGSKRPSADRIVNIENFIQKLGRELSETRLL